MAEVDYKALCERRKCKKCHDFLDDCNFYSAIKNGKKYYNSVCKSCQSKTKNENREAYLEYRKQQYVRNKETIKIQNKKSVDKNKERYYEYNQQYKKTNKETILEKGKEYYKKNKDDILLKCKNKRVEHQDLLNKRQRERRKNRTPEQKLKDANYKKEYTERNKKVLQEKSHLRNIKNRHKKREYHALRYRNDIDYKILHNLRSRIKNTARYNKKSDKTIKLLGCTIEHLRNHLKKLFTDGMTWELFMKGEIHVDHIKPCALFDLTKKEEQEKCFHFTNLQPLWKLDNLKKGAKYAA